MSPRSLIILHPGFEEMEAVTPIDILRRGDVEVVVASLHEEKSVGGRNAMTVQADVTLESVIDDSFDCLVLPGGPGTFEHLRKDSRVLDLVRKHVSDEKLVAAICAAPLVLKDSGVLPKSYTAHFSTKSELPDAQPSDATVIDGKIITSQGAGTATDFALEILKALKGADVSNAVAQSICHF